MLKDVIDVPRAGQVRSWVLLILGALSLLTTGCGAAAKRAPTPKDVRMISVAVSDVVYQCQSVAAGYVASADTKSLARDVDALLAAYRRVRPDAPFVTGGGAVVKLHSTLRRELALAAENLQNAGCSPGQGSRLATALGGY